MRIVRHTDQDYEARLRELTAPSSLFDPRIEERVMAIAGEVRERGDAALLEFTERFDGARLDPERLRVGTAELMAASDAQVEIDLDALESSNRNRVYRLQTLELRLFLHCFGHKEDGLEVTELLDEVQRVQAYVSRE